MKMTCDNAESLIPSYLDGELSEEQAAPLRRHLLDCHGCRDTAQDDQALKRWFAPEGALAAAAPAGFAARIARRAFAGDTGVLPDGDADVAPADRTGTEGTILSFVVRVTALAAAVLLVCALAIREERLPETPDLSAEEPYPQVLEELERLNRAEEGAETPEPRADEVRGR